MGDEKKVVDVEVKQDIQITPKKVSRKWKITAVIAIFLTLIFAAAAAFLVYWCSEQKTEIENLKTAISQMIQGEEGQADSDETADATKNNYLVVDEWGIKFELPEGLNDITYRIENSGGVGYLRLSSGQLNESCMSIDSPLGTIGRYTSSYYDNNSQQLPSRLNYSPINGYVYTYSHPQSSCSSVQEVVNLQNEQLELVKSMIDALTAV